MPRAISLVSTALRTLDAGLKKANLGASYLNGTTVDLTPTRVNIDVLIVRSPNPRRFIEEISRRVESRLALCFDLSDRPGPSRSRRDWEAGRLLVTDDRAPLSKVDAVKAALHASGSRSHRLC